MSDRVLVVDDDPFVVALASAVLDEAGFVVSIARSCAEARAAVKGFDGVVVLDVHLPDGLGVELVQELRSTLPANPVVMLTAHGNADLALRSLRAGAYDFVLKEHMAARLAVTVRHAHEERHALADAATSAFSRIVTRSPAMRSVLHALTRALASRTAVLIRGESGTGKELVARAIHAGGPRASGPFVAINCAGIPEALLEDELFGHERGSFTGAIAARAGRFDQARGGTLFLDEIGEMAIAMQAKLLRVLQDGDFHRVGGNEVRHADVRVVSATHRDLEAQVALGRFREDLYWRLAVFTVELPPLRQRATDIELLSRFFIDRAARSENRTVHGIDPLALALLESYSFPGNVRQLENVLRHAVLATHGDAITVADLPDHFLRAVDLELDREHGPDPTGPQRETPDRADPDLLPLREVERRHIEHVLQRVGGNKAEAARLLGIGRMTLYRKLSEYGLA